MKRYVSLFLLVMLVLASALPTGCVQEAQPTPTPTPEPTPLPKVFEKDVEYIVSTWWFGQIPEIRERHTLRFDLVAGNRVEGEVTILRIEDGTIIEGTGPFFALVRDPYWNIILQTAPDQVVPPELSGMHTTQYIHTQVYPWRFSFIAATSGEFSLEVNTGQWEIQGAGYDAHLKVTVYDK